MLVPTIIVKAIMKVNGKQENFGLLQPLSLSQILKFYTGNYNTHI